MRLLIILLIPYFCYGQLSIEYEASSEYPFGRLNPEAAAEVGDWDALIGTCDCASIARKPDQTWGESQKMTWTFKYILNGTAVQDESFKEDGSHSGSIRQFIADSSSWYVHWYSNTSPSTILPTWKGGKQGDSIVLYRDQTAPNGMEGLYRITFKDISEKGFNWLGEWVNKTETFSFPTWTIECVKRKAVGALDIIAKNTAAFSRAYMSADYDNLANLYAEDGKIFPSNSEIISGRPAIKKRWILPKGTKILLHKVIPSEVKVIDDYAYDYGYYEGKSFNKENGETSFKGKYLIVWKRVKDDWKIYLDIWNKL